MGNFITKGTKLSIFAVISGLGLIAWFLFSVFLSGEPLLAAVIWENGDERRGDALEVRQRDPDAYEAHSLELSPEMNPISISIAHWSRETGFPLSSDFTLVVEDSDGRPVIEKALRLSQKKKQSGSDTAIFEWAANTPTINLLDSYLDVPTAETYTFRLMPGNKGDNSLTKK